MCKAASGFIGPHMVVCGHARILQNQVEKTRKVKLKPRVSGDMYGFGVRVILLIDLFADVF